MFWRSFGRVAFPGLALGLVGVSFGQTDNALAYVPDASNNTIMKFVARTGEYKGLIGTGFVQNIRGLEQNPFDGLLYAAVRYVTGSTSSGSVVRLNPYTGEYLGLVGTGFLENPDDIAFGENGTMYVSDMRSAGTVIQRFNPTTGEYRGLFANGFLGTSNNGAAIVSAPNNKILIVSEGGPSIMRFDGVTGAYEGMIGSGFFSNGRGLAYVEDPTNPMVMVGANTATGSVFKFRTSDSSFRGLIAASGFVPFVRGMAVMPNGWLLVRGFSTGTEYVARFVPETGEYKGLFAANFNTNGVGLATETPARVTGNLVFGNYIGTGVSRPVTFTVWSGSTLLDTQTINVTPNETNPTPYVFTTYARGNNLRVMARGTRWLRRASGAVNIAVGGVSGVNLSMINGDVDGSGEIDLTDIDQVISQYLQSPATPEDGDVDGSTEVDLTDIDIVIANYLQSDDQ